MNNKEFAILLKEWKQKNKQEDLEENLLQKAQKAAAGVALATGLGMTNPAAAEPAKKPAVTQQVQKKEKKELKDLTNLSEEQKYVIGIYVQSINNSMKNNVGEAIKKIQALRNLINNDVELNEEAEKQIEDTKKENFHVYDQAVKLAEESISKKVRYQISNYGGLEKIEKFEQKDDPKPYGSDAFDSQQEKK